ncbi:MAG: ferredoxin family protein, partial [Planctomycetota bacterium]
VPLRTPNGDDLMAHVVTGACQGCTHTLCVTVCPCDCFRDGGDMLYIDPDSCTDCELCTGECPESAIFFEGDVPVEQQQFIQMNAERAPNFPEITETKT